MTVELQRAVANAVTLVNSNSGQTCVRLRFSDDSPEIDFVANAARCDRGNFEFQAGFETYGGSVEELSDIRAEIIGH
jgi:hypothetical protein